MDEEKKEEAGIGAKELSKGSMFFASFWIGILTILKAIGVLKNIEITDILYSGLAIVGVWCPTYFSIWLDKIKEIKFGAKND